MAPKRETALEAWGRELQHACEAAGMTGKQLAETLHVVPATVSQWMNGRRTPYLKDVERCDAAVGTHGYLVRYFKKWVTQEIPSEWRDRWLSAEARATLVQNFELSVIPGLLQTEAYARTVIGYNRHSSIPVDERVRRRMARQAILSDDNPPMCIFVIDEYALHRPVGGPDIMKEQLTHLWQLAERPNIVVQIVPSDAQYYAGSPFMIVEFDGTKLANLDTALRGQVIEGHDEVAEITRIWVDIQGEALTPRASIEALEKAVERWER